MTRPFLTLLLATVLSPLVVSCGLTESEPKPPPGPVSESSRIPWNAPVAGQGQGNFGMLPQNQFRR